MKIKLLAVGNVLMEDDGVAVFLAAALEKELNGLGIEVIYGETDISYSLSRIEDGELILILDAGRLGREAGEVTLLTPGDKGQDTLHGHDISVSNLIKLFYPGCCCYILAIEAFEVDFHYGPSSMLSEMFSVISQRIMKIIGSILCNRITEKWEDSQDGSIGPADESAPSPYGAASK